MGFRYCPKCGGKVADSRSNCIHCDFALPATAIAPDYSQWQENGYRICPQCGAKISNGIKECLYCGANVPIPENCPDCGGILDFDTLICPDCGYAPQKERPRKAPFAQRTDVRMLIIKLIGIALLALLSVTVKEMIPFAVGVFLVFFVNFLFRKIWKVRMVFMFWSWLTLFLSLWSVAFCIMISQGTENGALYLKLTVAVYVVASVILITGRYKQLVSEGIIPSKKKSKK